MVERICYKMVDFNDININQQKQNGITPANQDPLVAQKDNTRVKDIIIDFKIPYANSKNDPVVDNLKKLLETKLAEITPLDTGNKELENAVKTALPNASDKFISQIEDMAEKLKCDPIDVAALLFKESKFNPKAGNGSFKGIGQMNLNSLKASIKYAVKHPEEAEGIDPGMTMAKFVRLSREEQMPYVKNYTLFMKETYLGKNKEMSGGDLYALFYTPGYAKKHVLTSANSPSKGVRAMYRSNKGLDKLDDNFNEVKNGDGKITKDDLQFTLDSVKTDVFKIPEEVVMSKWNKP